MSSSINKHGRPRKSAGLHRGPHGPNAFLEQKQYSKIRAGNRRNVLTAAELVGIVTAVVGQVAELGLGQALVVGALEIGRRASGRRFGAHRVVVFVRPVAAVVIAVALQTPVDAFVVVASELQLGIAFDELCNEYRSLNRSIGSLRGSIGGRDTYDRGLWFRHCHLRSRRRRRTAGCAAGRRGCRIGTTPPCRSVRWDRLQCS